MKYLSEDVLKDYGFKENPKKGAHDVLKVMSKNQFDVIIKNDGMYFIDERECILLKDTASLRKVYKEVTCNDLLNG